MELTSWFPMPKVVGLTTYTDQRNSSSCAETVSAEECYRVVLGSKWHNWYYADLMFGQNSIIFLCVGLGVFALANLVFRLRQHKYGQGLGNDPIYLWLAGLGRYASSRQWRLSRRRGYTLTLGQTTTICVLILFFSVMTLAPKPYYWPNLTDFGGSPPIATRTGYMAIAILPFQVLLATRLNLMTCLTGVSHEKLQVFHRWMGWIMYVLALIHTFPFIIVDRKLGTMDMVMQSDWYTVSGIICLVPQTLLVSLSIAPIRNKAYELFKGIHFVLAAFFIVFLFLHCGFTMTSALYFVGFAAAYSFSWLIRFLIILKNGLPTAIISASPSTSQHSSSPLLHVTIPLPPTSRLHWKAGQHYFIRFFTRDAHMLTSHPFTAASAPGDGALEFVIKPEGGMSGALARKLVGVGADIGDHEVEKGEREEKGAKRGKKEVDDKGVDNQRGAGQVGMQVKVTLDGPYGGISGDIEAYDRVVLIAGGSGISFLLGALSHLVHHSDLRTRHITIVYTTRDAEMAKHYRQTLIRIAHRLNGPINTSNAAHVSNPQVDVYVHISSLATSSPDYDPEQATHIPENSLVEGTPTALLHDTSAGSRAVQGQRLETERDCCRGPSAGSSRDHQESPSEIEPAPLPKEHEDDSDSDSAYSHTSTDLVAPGSRHLAQLQAGRPDIAAHVRRLTSHYGTAAIAVCGPKELVYDARNAVAEEQLNIVRGDTACTDLYLHTEVFEW